MTDIVFLLIISSANAVVIFMFLDVCVEFLFVNTLNW